MGEFTKIKHSATTETVGCRENGSGRSRDGLLDVRLALPGSDRIGTNPEQLLGIAWSISFASAVRQTALAHNIELPKAIRVHADVHLADDSEGVRLSVQLNIKMPDINLRSIDELIDEARRICPYCKATSGNICVELIAG